MLNNSMYFIRHLCDLMSEEYQKINCGARSVEASWGVCVCVLAGLQTEQYEKIMRWWGSKPQ